MPHIQVDMRHDDRPELEAFLGDRLYEFNATTTGIFDGKLLNASVERTSDSLKKMDIRSVHAESRLKAAYL